MDKSALAIPAMAKLGLAAVGAAGAASVGAAAASVGAAGAAWMGVVTAGLTTQTEAIVVLQKAALASQERELRLIGLIENLSKVDGMQNVSCRPAPWAQPSGSTQCRPLRIQRHETRGARLQETLGKTAEALGSMQTETLAMVGELTALEQRTAALKKPSAATLAITTGMAGEPSHLKTGQSNIVAQIVSCAAPLRPADLSSAPATHEGCRAARACREPLPSRSSRATRRPWRRQDPVEATGA